MRLLAFAFLISTYVSSAYADDDNLFPGATHLERAALVEAVLARNPDVAAAESAIAAARARARGAGALADPTLSYAVAPLSVTGHAFGHRVEVRQRLPFPGKRAPARAMAAADVDMAIAEVADVRLELAQMASDMYDEYYVVGRTRAINAHHRALAVELEESATAQYIAGRASQQDPLMARSRAAELAREQLELAAQHDEIIAQLNGLLHRAPDAPLPPPPPELVAAPAPDGTSAELQARALERRPQRAGVRARIRAAEAEAAMARSERLPDLELMAAYDSMTDMPEHRWMVGVMVDLPLQRGKRRAALDAARAERRRMTREDEKLVDGIRVEVERAHRRVTAARETVALDESTVLPAAQARLDAARAGFIANQNDFVAVIDADEMLRDAELEREMARAELSKRNAALARSIGDIPGLKTGGAP
jgi:cobalt-zinc-cadmium efflux system outer membrane protein